VKITTKYKYQKETRSQYNQNVTNSAQKVNSKQHRYR